MELKKLLNGLEKVKAKGNVDIDITKIENDSRKIEPGTLFVAIKGFEVDGHQFVNQAIEKGASAIMVEEGMDLKSIALKNETTLLVVPDTRYALAIIACNYRNKR